jgi:hypothetical protein
LDVAAYSAFGLVVSSNVPLPGLPEVVGKRPDCVLEVRPGPIKERSIGRRHALRLPNGAISLIIGRCGSGFLVRFPGLAVFVISRDGQKVRCAPRRGTRSRVVAHLFLAQVLPLALSQRGRLVLHASAVATQHGAVAFLGAAGQGKSTLSASFVRRSFPLLADDGLLLVEDGTMLAGVPSYPEIRLWPDVLAVLGDRGLEVHDVAHRTGKKRLTIDRGPWMFSREPVPVRRLYVLGRAPAAARARAVTITALTPREAFIELVKHTYRLDLDDHTRLRDEFDSISRIAARPSLVYRLAFRRDLSRLPLVQAAILEHCGS